MKKVLVLIFGVLSLMTTTYAVAAPAIADAKPACADVVVFFARGTMETDPPVGTTGLAFGNSLKALLPGKSVAVRAINYPASANFKNRQEIVDGVIKGVNNAQQRIRRLADSCPNTKVVLGGYSQGAVVASYVVSDGVALPAQYIRGGAQNPKPLPAAVSKNIAAVVLFAPPSNTWVHEIGAPSLQIGHAYRTKTKKYCNPGDTVCDGSPVGPPNAFHVLYQYGPQFDAAWYAASRV